MIQVVELVDCSQQIMFNDTPATFEEDTDETVRARGFHLRHGFDGYLNLLCGER
jgi:hypothetical protein